MVLFRILCRHNLSRISKAELLRVYRTNSGGTTWNKTELNLPEKDDYGKVQKGFAFEYDKEGTYSIF